MNKDEEHLRLLAIFHYVAAGIAALFSLFPIFHLVMGFVMIFAPEIMGGGGQPPPMFLGWIFVVIAAVAMTIGLVFALMVFLNGRFLARNRHYTFCLVVAGIECLFMPVGTILGVFTILVLQRDSVRARFAGLPSAQLTAPPRA